MRHRLCCVARSVVLCCRAVLLQLPAACSHEIEDRPQAHGHVGGVEGTHETCNLHEFGAPCVRRSSISLMCLGAQLPVALRGPTNPATKRTRLCAAGQRLVLFGTFRVVGLPSVSGGSKQTCQAPVLTSLCAGQVAPGCLALVRGARASGVTSRCASNHVLTWCCTAN